MSGKQTVRCLTCFWTGQRKTDLQPDAIHPKTCPDGHEVRVGAWPPTTVEETPSGFEIAFYDSVNIESGQSQQRRYLVNGDRFPSVTGILRILDKSDALIPWAIGLEREGLDWREVRDEAGERGTSAHSIALDVLTGRQRRLSSIEEAHRPYGQAVMRWVADRRPEPHLTEALVASVEHGYSGRFDFYGDVGGAAVRVDFKSVTDWKDDRGGNRYPPYAENVLQLDLYEGAAVESGYPPADYGLIVRLGPDGTYDEAPFELDPDRGLAVLGAYRAKSRADAALRIGLLQPQLAVAA